MNETNPQQVKQIERDEAWLAGVMADYPEPAPTGLENIKLSVRIAAQRHILDDGTTPPPSRETLDRIKLAVRAELTSQARRDLETTADRSVAHRWGGVRWSSVFGGLAAAAALAFWFVPANVTSPPSLNPRSAAIEDFIAVMTHETISGSTIDEVSDDWSAQVAAFESELDEVADLLVSDDSGWDDYRLNDLDAIDDAINELFQEIEDALDT